MTGEPYSKERQLRARPGEMRVCAATDCIREFYAAPRQIRRGHARFCSRACAYRSRPKSSPETVEKRRRAIVALNRAGERNPNFRHGRRSGWQIRGWSVAAKGETCCRACGGGGVLHLHHAIPRSLWPPEARRDLRNGITLCNHCHISWHRGGRVLHRTLFTADEWAYLSSLTLTGRETGAWLDKHYPLGEDGLVRLFGATR